MKSNDCDVLSDCEYPSNIKNNSIKRSFSKTNESIMSDDDISCKKKKVDKTSQENEINAVLTTSNGYMTRNRVKKELTEKNKLSNEFTQDSEPTNKSKTGKRIRNPVKTVQNNKLKRGYVFTHDIFSEKQSSIQHKKNIPSLFESDSESEIESYHLNDNLKMLDDMKEKPINSPELECTPAFNKNIEVKTYFNKKTHSVNNISNNMFSDIFEEKNQIQTSSSFSYQVENYIGFNECEKISQIEKESYEPLEILDPTVNVEDSINDERIIVTDAFIRELEKEIQMENTFLQDVSKTQELSHDTNAVKSIISKTNHNLNSEVKPGENSLEFISVLENQEIFDDTNSIKSNESNVHHSENEITSQHFGKITDFHSTPKNQDICYDTNNFKPNFSNIELHLDTEMISNNSVVPSSDHNYLKNSKCQCKVFYAFNKDANKILTSKIKHFAFNKNVKKVRQKLLHQKHLEANNLKMLISDDKKYTAQLNMCLPTMNLIPMNIKHEKCINLKVNHIDEPSILNMFKDDYKDEDCIPKYISDHKSPKLQRNNKINVQASIQKPTDNKNGNDISTFTINSRLPIENLVHSGKNIISDNNDIKTNFKLPDENCVNMDQNKVSNNVFESSFTSNNENPFDFGENKITNNMVSSNNATNKKLHNENHKDSENKITDDITLSCFTKHKHLLNENELGDVIVSNINKNNENHYKNFLDDKKITNNIDSSNITTNQKNLCDENQFNYVKNKSFSKISIPSITKNKKLLCANSLYSSEDKIVHETFESKATINTKNNKESHPNFGEYKIADNIISSISTNKKCSHENLVNFVENEISDKITIPSITKNKNLFENSIDSSKDKISHEDFESKITTKNNIHRENRLNYGENKFVDNIFISNFSTNSNLCNENLDNFVENKISDNIVLSKTTSTYKKINDENQINSPKSNVSNIVASKITTNKKLDDENQVNFVKNKISDNIITSKTTTTNKKIDDENQIKSPKNNVSDNIVASKITKTNKKLDDKNQVNYVKNNIHDDIVKSKIKPTNENQINFVKKKIYDNIIVSKITTNNEVHNNKDLNWYKNEMSDNIFSGIEKNTTLFHENSVNFDGKNKISDCENNKSNISKKTKPENELYFGENFVDFDCDISHSICEKNDFDFDNDCKSSIMNFNFDSNHEIKAEKNSFYNENSCSKLVTVNHDIEMEIKPLNSSQLKHDTLLLFSTENNIPDEKHNQLLKSKTENILNIDTIKTNSEIIHIKPTQNTKYENKADYLSNHVSKQPNIALFDIIPNDDFENSNCSSDDENRLLIDYEDNFEVNKNSTPVHSLNDKAKNPTVTNNLLSDENNEDCILEIEFSKNEMTCLKNRKSVESSIANSDIALKPTLLKEELDSSNINENESSSVSKMKKYFSDFITKEACNNLYKKILNDDSKNKNEYFSKNIQDILKEMYVDDTFVTACQHMIDLCDDIPKKNDSIYFQTDSEHINSTSEKKVCVTETQNDVKIFNPDFSQSIQTNTKALFKFNNEQENNKSNNLSNKTKNVDSKQKSNNSKSNMKIRVYFREFIKSNKPINEILESKEFRNLRFFKEEEIACSIGAFIFEKTIEPPIITGLSSYKVNCDQLSYEEKNKLLGSTNLNIICPKIMKLTTITLALVKMLRSDTLIDLILNVIRKNVLNKQMNMYHTIDSQLITQIVYYVDICTRLRLLKTLQTFIIDSMVFIPNKYCCVIFVSLLLWKNCLPRFMNNEQDPVIIMALSYLIAKKKFYSEQIAGCDIFQRELINLLSFYFNYQFSTDLPVNFIQHIHKPDFFVSVIMFIKCCDPKDLTEFMVNCLFPIIEDYLKTLQNESNALKTMESIIVAIRPFKVACNATVATYLKKYKGSISSSKKDDKEHIYDIMYHNYRTMQDKFIEYLNNYKSYSQKFEESLVSLIMVLGSVDYLSSCLSLMKWKPKFEPSAGLFKKIDMFKSIIGHNLWNKLCLMDDINTIKCLVNSCLLKKDVYTTIVQLHALC